MLTADNDIRGAGEFALYRISSNFDETLVLRIYSSMQHSVLKIGNQCCNNLQMSLRVVSTSRLPQRIKSML